MKTVHSITVGRRLVVLRSDGNVYIAEPEPQFASADFDRNPKLVATSAAGCEGLADALREIASKIREGGAP